MDMGLKPEQIRESMSMDLILVWPELKSYLPIKAQSCHVSSSPGTRVFSVDPLRKAQPSKMLATTKSVVNILMKRMLNSRFSVVSVRPGTSSQKCSVFAIHSMTLSSPARGWKLQTPLRLCSSCCSCARVQVVGTRALVSCNELRGVN